MNHNDTKFDCLHFKGSIPCKPNKIDGSICSSCLHYQKIEKRILLTKLAALGDVIRTTPLLEKLRFTYHNAHITWLTLSPSILPKDRIDELLSLNEVSLFNLQHTPFDVVINLDKEKEACLLTSLISAQEKYGFTWKNGHLAACTPAAEHKLLTGYFDGLSKENTKTYLEEIFEICHFTFNKEEYVIHLNEKMANFWKEKLAKLSDGKTIIGLNTGCGPRWNTRLWSDEKWIETANSLQKLGYFPIFLGGELEHAKNERLASVSGCYYPGHFSLEEFIALTNNCDVIITQVTMMMHIATALKKKMVLMNTIFNPFEFELCGRGILVGPPSPCQCYFGNSCQFEAPCMLSIQSAEVVNSMQQII
jgi:ADP-heptose:LPS heptosyltransferase